MNMVVEMNEMYDKEKLQDKFYANAKDLQDRKHAHIMEELEFMFKAGIKSFHRGK